MLICQVCFPTLLIAFKLLMKEVMEVQRLGVTGHRQNTWATREDDKSRLSVKRYSIPTMTPLASTIQ